MNITDPRPVRVQLSRKKGWRMPPNTVRVDRTTKWGNPYQIGATDPDRRGGINYVMTCPTDLARAFRGYAYRCIDTSDTYFRELRGRNLACWCPLDQPCHADVLLEIANK